jgi:Ser/Thr protein kinase RdoA (MazF antagonist)
MSSQYETSSAGNRQELFYQNGKTKIQLTDFEQVARRHDLGRITAEPVLEQNGIINYNFKVKTTTGEYMVRVRRADPEKDKEREESLEYKATDFLQGRFSYQTPFFIPNDDGMKFTRIDGNTFETYERLLGVNPVRGVIPRAEIARAIAEYHNTIAGFPKYNLPKIQPTYFDPKGNLAMSLERVFNSLGTDEASSTIKSNSHLISWVYEALRTRPHLSERNILAHSDYHYGNILSQDNRITGIIDFANAKWATKARDLVKITEPDPQDIASLVREYRRYGEMSDAEADRIMPDKLLQALNVICWSYAGVEKGDRLRLINKALKTIGKIKEHWQ